MIRVAVLYPKAGDNWFNMEYYLKNHVPLVKKLFTPFGMKSIELDHGIGGLEGAPPYFAIAHLTFDTADQFNAAIAAHMKDLGADMANYTRDAVVQVGERVDLSDE